MTDSPYNKKLKEIGEKNKTISDTFCVAKWKQVSINLTAGLTHSCYHPPEHKIPLEELADNPSALHNTSFKKQERKMMLEGKRPTGCAYCWKIEDSPGNHVSDRNYRSLELKTIQPDVYEEITQNSEPATYDVVPTNVEVNFSGVCNFKCSYCSPHLSTEWKKEIEKYGPYPTTVPHNSIDYFKNEGLMPIPNKDYNPYIDSFWKWWPELYPKLSLFRMTGGEPLMDVNTYKVFDHIIDNPNKNLHIALTTNLCPDERLLNKFFTKLDQINQNKAIREFTLYVSCDGYQARAEYIRNGMDYDYLESNAETFLKNYNSSSGIIYTLAFIATINLLSITSLRSFIDNTVLRLRATYNKDSVAYDTRKFNQRVFLDTPILHYPAWQSIQILPSRYCDILRSDIEYFKSKLIPEEDMIANEDYGRLRDFEIEKLERVLSWMEQGQQLPEEKIKRDRADFYKFFTEHDLRRDTSFLETYPEMEDFWLLCKEAADDR
jgi:pyruvate-formate lyase-activating enzyme